MNNLNIDKFNELTITIKGVNTSKNESFNVTIEGLELEFEINENTYNNSLQLLNDTQVIQENQVVINNNTIPRLLSDRE